MTPDPTPLSAPAPASMGLGKGRYLIASLAVLVLDQWTKWLVNAHLPEHFPHPVIPGFFNLTHVKNTGVAFGMFAESGRDGGAWLLTALGVAVLGFVAVYFWRLPGDHKLLQAALALILGGAVGNLIDRAAVGAVTDFIDLYYGSYHWHTFNIADSAITIGICLIGWDTLRSLRRAPAEGAPEPAD